MQIHFAEEVGSLRYRISRLPGLETFRVCSGFESWIRLASSVHEGDVLRLVIARARASLNDSTGGNVGLKSLGSRHGILQHDGRHVKHDEVLVKASFYCYDLLLHVESRLHACICCVDRTPGL